MVLPYPPCKLHSKVIMEEQETACLQITILWITLPKKERSRIITYRIPNEFDLFPKRCQEWHSSSSLKCSWSSTVIEQTWNTGIGKYAHYQALQPYFVLNCQSFCSVLSPRWAKWHLWAGQASVALATLRRTLPLHALLSARSPSP